MTFEVRVDKPTQLVFQCIDLVSAKLGIKWFLLGAYSRVLLCEEVLGIPAGRATYDVDIGVCINTLEQFDAMCRLLIEHHTFQRDKDQTQRLIHSSGILVDIVPFGVVAEPFERYVLGN